LKNKTTSLYILIFIALLMLALTIRSAQAEPPTPNAKFYDFGEQIIDGQIKKPTALYTDARQKVKFGRLLELKKSFLPNLINTAKYPVFK
tara:strand:+ start:2379 stop:2648 length:270 start_codon:yes stop_codon:yes gene_type:complete